MAKTILNFHFDYLKASLSWTDCENISSSVIYVMHNIVNVVGTFGQKMCGRIKKF